MKKLFSAATLCFTTMSFVGCGGGDDSGSSPALAAPTQAPTASPTPSPTPASSPGQTSAPAPTPTPTAVSGPLRPVSLPILKNEFYVISPESDNDNFGSSVTSDTTNFGIDFLSENGVLRAGTVSMSDGSTFRLKPDPAQGEDRPTYKNAGEDFGLFFINEELFGGSFTDHTVYVHRKSDGALVLINFEGIGTKDTDLSPTFLRHMESLDSARPSRLIFSIRSTVYAVQASDIESSARGETVSASVLFQAGHSLSDAGYFDNSGVIAIPSVGVFQLDGTPVYAAMDAVIRRENASSLAGKYYRATIDGVRTCPGGSDTTTSRFNAPVRMTSIEERPIFDVRATSDCPSGKRFEIDAGLSVFQRSDLGAPLVFNDSNLGGSIGRIVDDQVVMFDEVRTFQASNGTRILFPRSDNPQLHPRCSGSICIAAITGVDGGGFLSWQEVGSQNPTVHSAPEGQASTISLNENIAVLIFDGDRKLRVFRIVGSSSTAIGSYTTSSAAEASTLIIPVE